MDGVYAYGQHGSRMFLEEGTNAGFNLLYELQRRRTNSAGSVMKARRWSMVKTSDVRDQSHHKKFRQKRSRVITSHDAILTNFLICRLYALLLTPARPHHPFHFREDFAY